MAEVEAAAEKASRELAEYKAESAELRNQDLTIRRLEERVRGLEADLQEKVRPAARHVSRVHAPAKNSVMVLTRSYITTA